MVAYYLFENTKYLFNQTTHHGIYRDNGLLVFKGKKSTQEIRYWLAEFQQKVDKAAGNQHLQFIAEKWKNGTNIPSSAKKDMLQTTAKNELQFLDMKMSWSSEGDLQYLSNWPPCAPSVLIIGW